MRLLGELNEWRNNSNGLFDDFDEEYLLEFSSNESIAEVNITNYVRYVIFHKQMQSLYSFGINKMFK